MRKLFVIILIITTTFFASQVLAEQNIPLQNSVLRLHVLANSDAPNDQALKLEVKDHVVNYMKDEFSNIKDIDKAILKAEEKLPDIQKVAEEIVRGYGYDYPVEVLIGQYEFPTKAYGNLVFPQGDYEAVRILIGDGVGKNWWCVLFPPLCMVSSADKGLSMDKPHEAKVSLKCLELLPKGVKFHKPKKD
ncbi:MAG TPA: stage II sporulation protein R [Syntrophomonadaceae bacterium]|nr:stage II sporulation protein R [Syntrophomonadaceae bacterium]